MSGVGLGEITESVQHKGVVSTGIIGFDLGENGGELIAGMDRLIENIGEGAPGFDGDEMYSS